jgi:hypothetical protein
VTSDALIDGSGFAVSTRSVEAATAYAAGVELLVTSSSEAVAVLRVAVESDPHFGLARVALACALAAAAGPPDAGACDRSPPPPRASTRRERQHIEVVQLALSGERDRAAVLGREHLREFPRDVLVAHILTSCGIA